MLRLFTIAVALASCLSTAQAQEVGYLFCKMDDFEGNKPSKDQTLPVYYDNDQLVAFGKASHCVDEPVYNITDSLAEWRCIVARDPAQNPTQSMFVQIQRYTGRLHRNDIKGDYRTATPADIIGIWHGSCTVHFERQF